MDETTPQAEVSAEDILASMFEKQGYTDNPEPDEVDEPEDEQEVEATESDDDAEESTAEAATEETEEDGDEVEYEGKSYKLPKELKDALLRQKDYTQKTQEVARERRVAEQLAEQARLQNEFQSAHLPKMVEIHALEAQLKQYAQVNWAELAESNPAQCMTLQMQRNVLKEQADALKGDLQRLAHEHGNNAVELRQQAQARCIEEVRKDIKGFDADMLKSIDDTARTFGFSGEELAQVTDPRVVKVLHAAMQYQKLQGTKSITAKKVLDVKPVQVKSSRTAQTSQANAALQATRARLKSTGRPSDAEALLTARFAKSMR